jgi:energy-coupling factor transporter ATP-binding protein EcfA2
MTKTYFFAYASKPVHVGDTITAASARLRSASLKVIPWQELEIAGNFIRNQVLNAIEDCDLFIADLSVANFNVSYEIGYAIGTGKPILLVRNASVDEGPIKLQDIGLFDTIGYSEYENSDSLQRTIAAAGAVRPLLVNPTLNLGAPVYTIEPKHKSDYIMRIRSRFERARMSTRTFDPQETPRLSSWEAIEQVAQSYGVFVPLLSKVFADHNLHNMRAAFIAGLASGMKKPMMIVQDALEQPIPLDYRDLVKACPNFEEINKAVAIFVAEVMQAIQATRPKEKSHTNNLLTSLSLGANAAENEAAQLEDYYLPIEAFNQALRGEAHVVVGRKGSGKSALFFQLIKHLQGKKNAVVIDLKPETSQLLKLKQTVLSFLEEGTREHTIMAFWEYVLLVEIAGHILEADRERHLRDPVLFEAYRALEKGLAKHSIQFEGSFADRVAKLVNRLVEDYKGVLRDGAETSLDEGQVTSIIYKTAVAELGQLIFRYLRNKKEVWLLFDNLDKGWSTDGLDKTDLTLVRCLIDACRKLQQRLSREDVQVHSTLFLRNDVYELMVRATADKGKEAAVKVDWTDPDLLREMLRLRLVSSGDLDPEIPFDDAWRRICASHYRGEETSQYLIDRCLMRPRFLIDLVSYCKSSACNLGNSKIEESDVEKGLRNYSNDLLSDLQYELHDIDPQAEDVFYSFIDYTSSFGQDELAAALENAGIAADKRERVVEMLLWYGFLGLAQNGDRSRFIYNVNYEMKILSGLRKRVGADIRYCINPAFFPALGIKSNDENRSLF